MRLVSLCALIAIGVACQEYSLKGEPTPPDLEDTDVDTDLPPTPPTPPADAPDIEVTPLALSFGFLPPQCQSQPDMVTVSNVGGSDLEVYDIFLMDGSGAFNEDGVAMTLAPGESAFFFVDFIPPADGGWSDRIRIASNDPDETTVDILAAGTGASSGTIVDGFQQNVTGQVDVLFVLDNSGSMSSNLAALGAAFPTFINNFLALGLDFQIGVVTTDMDDLTQSGRLVGPVISNSTPDPAAEFLIQTDLGSGGSADERGLDAAFAALDPSAGLIQTVNAGLVRPGSNLSILVISDENDSSNMNPVPFTTWLNAYQGDPDLTSLSIVGGPKAGLFPCVSIFNGLSAMPVPRYWNVAQATGGIHVNLCNVDFTSIVQQLSSVAAGLRSSYTLQGAPEPATISVSVNGANVPQNPNNGWTYDPASNTIQFNGSSVPAEGADVAITYQGETVCPN